MALIPCKDCGEQISGAAVACPKCGSVAHKTRVWPWVVGVPLLLFVLFIGYGFTIPEYETKARQEREICYKLVAAYERAICDRNFDEAIQRGRNRK